MIDLHIHTNYSDGTDSLKELLKKAENQKLEIISITDHDQVDAYYELENKDIREIFKGKIIPGVELKAFYNGIPVEVLGYGIDYKKIKIKNRNIYDIQTDSLERFKEIGRDLGLNFDEKISVSKTDSRRKFASFVFATEILKYKENEKKLLSIGPKFSETSFYRVHTSNKNSIFYYDESQYGVSLEEAINIIHNSGGIAIFAHPLVYPFENKLKEIEDILIKYDIDGLECEYPLFNEKERDSLKKLAIKYNKYISGGTDYHAKNKPDIMLASGINENIKITKDLIDRWINKVKKI